MTRSPRYGSALLPLAVLLFEGQASSDAPAGQYTLTTNTGLDARTKLRWMRGYHPQAASGSESWAKAAQLCQSLSLDGFVGWRLPTVRELESIYDPRRSDANMWDGNVFSPPPAAGAATLWSSTEVAGDPAKIEGRDYFNRAYQLSNRAPLARTDHGGVKCVRDP